MATDVTAQCLRAWPARPLHPQAGHCATEWLSDFGQMNLPLCKASGSWSAKWAQ